MLIAPLSPAHYDAAVELWHEAGLTRPWNDPIEDLRRALAGPESTVIRTDNVEACEFYAALGYNRDEVAVFSHRLERTGRRTKAI